jgi:hypothetical protein
MQPDITRLFAEAILGYRQGKMTPIMMSAGAAGDLYRALAQGLIQERLSAADHAQYLVVRDLSRQAVELATQARYEAARQAFGQATTYLQERSESEEVHLLGQSWIDQGEAYLAVRLQQWCRARQRLQSAMAAETALEEQYGYALFHIGRVHLGHLLLRVEAGSGNAPVAVDLAQQIVEYVLGQRDGLPFGHGWSTAHAAQTPAALRYAMLARIASEVGTVLALQPFEQAQTLLQRFPSWQQFDGHPQLAEIYHWGQTKAAFLQGHTVNFLTHCAAFLHAGRRETTLWYATVLDLCRCSAAMRPAATAAFRLEVADDATHWQELPAPLLPPMLRTRLMQNGAAVPADRGYRHHTPARQFQAYNVGLPRTGTSSIYSLFGRYRAGNEFMERETVTRLVEWHAGKLSDAAFREYVLRRDREGGLEMDAASFNHFYLDILVEAFPRAKFLCTMREPYSWMNSYCKLLLRWRQHFAARGDEPPQWMTDYGRLLFGTFTWEAFASPAILQSRLPELMDGFLRHWGEANRRILAILPRERSLVIRTHELSAQLDAVARFIGVPRESLTADHHTNMSPDDSDLLQGLDTSLFAERCVLYASDVLQHVGFSLR